MKVNNFQKIQPPTVEDQKAKIQEVAESYEKMFLREMVKQMRSTVSESELMKASQGEKIFKSMLDEEYVESWGKSGGIGMAGMIYDQIVEKYAPHLAPREERPRGPIKMDEKSQNVSPFVAHVSNELSTKSKTAMTFTRPENAANEAALEITSPWAGTLLGSKRLDSDENLLELTHSNGLKSQMVFKGQVLPGLENQQIHAGQAIGLLSPQARSLHWNVEVGPKAIE